MLKTFLLKILQEDLMNERKHMNFYLQSSVMVKGLYRKELVELFKEEAASEMNHVLEFSEFISSLDSTPLFETNEFPISLKNPEEILRYAMAMEQEVATNYAWRIQTIEDFECKTPEEKSLATYAILFYEDQLQDSQKAALDLRKYFN